MRTPTNTTNGTKSSLHPFISSSLHRAFSLVEVLVVASIFAVLLAIFLPAVQKAREACLRLKCQNNMKQIGLAVTNFRQAKNRYPIDNDGYIVWLDYYRPETATVVGKLIWETRPALGWTPVPFYVDILPYIEEQNQSSADAKPIEAYLCPSRRTVAEAGARDDYGLGSAPDLGAKGNPEYWNWRWVQSHVMEPASLDATPVSPLPFNYTIPGWPFDSRAFGKHAILGSPAEPDLVINGEVLRWARGTVVKPNDIQDGFAHTLLLAHKGMSPRHYAGGPNDAGWATTGNAAQHKRKPDAFYRDANQPNIEFALSTPHSSMPCLWADGRVSMISCGIQAEQLWPLWSYNDGIPTDDIIRE